MRTHQLLAPPPRKIYARMANENVWSVNENSGSAFVSRPTDQRMKEENQMQNMQCIKNEVNDFACNLFIILVSKTFYSVQFIFSQVSWKMTYILIGTNLIPYESNKRADGSQMRSNHSRVTLMSYTDHSAQRRALELLCWT